MNKIIAGRQPVMEALKAGMPVEKVIFLRGVHGTIVDEIKRVARTRGIPLTEATRMEFRELASDATTQGVIALVASTQQLSSFEDILAIPHNRGERGFLLILDEIEDPQNLGALIRTAECAGVHGVIIPKHHSAGISGATIKASAGATAYVSVGEVTNIVNAIKELKSNGYWIVGLDMAGTKPFREVDYTMPVAIVVGSEGKGIRRLVKEHCDFLVKIPLLGKIASLNASVAGALVMYEVTSQRLAR